MADGRKIVVVDDDESFRESICALLSTYDFAVGSFTSAEALLRSDAWRSADCLLIDATLPGATGPELQGLLLQLGSRTPVILLSGYVDDRLRSQALQGGAVACLGKPFEEDELLAALDEAFAANGRSS